MKALYMIFKPAEATMLMHSLPPCCRYVCPSLADRCCPLLPPAAAHCSSQTLQGYQLWCNPRTQYTGNQLSCYFGYFNAGQAPSDTYCCGKVTAGPDLGTEVCAPQTPMTTIFLRSTMGGTDYLQTACCKNSVLPQSYASCSAATPTLVGGGKWGEGSVSLVRARLSRLPRLNRCALWHRIILWCHMSCFVSNRVHSSSYKCVLSSMNILPSRVCVVSNADLVAAAEPSAAASAGVALLQIWLAAPPPPPRPPPSPPPPPPPKSPPPPKPPSPPPKPPPPPK